MRESDPYTALGVPRSAVATEIKTAFRRRARALHPDVNRTDPDAAEKFKELVAAYELLCDPLSRSAYDRERERNGRTSWNFASAPRRYARRVEQSDRPPPQVWTIARATRLNEHVGPLRRRRARAAPLLCVVVSPDLCRLATHRGEAAHLWDTASGRRVAWSTNDERPVQWLDFSPDGRWLITHGLRGTVLWDASNGREVERLNLERPADLRFSSNGRHFATAAATLAQVVDVAGGRVVAEIPHEAPLLSLALSGDGRRLATGAHTTARVCEVPAGRRLAEMIHEKPVVSVELSPDGQLLATSTTVARSGWTPSVVHLWDVGSGLELARLRHRCWVDRIKFSPDGQRLVTDSNGALRLWDLRAGRQLIRANTIVTSAPAFSPDGRWLVAGSRHEAYVWDTQTGHQLACLRHAAEVMSVAVDYGGMRLVTASLDGGGGGADSSGQVTAHVWDNAAGRLS